MLMGVSGSRAKKVAENTHIYFVINTSGQNKGLLMKNCILIYPPNSSVYAIKHTIQ